MKTKNAINLIKKELGQEPVIIATYRSGKKYSIDHIGNTLSFIDTRDNDCENVYVVRSGLDNGYNGYNGIFPTSLKNAIQLMK